MKPRIYRHQLLNRKIGRATTAEGVSKQNSHPFKVMQMKIICIFVLVSFISHVYPTLINAIGCVKGIIELLC